MSEPVKVNVVSYGGVKPGQVVVGNKASGERTTLFDAATAVDGTYMFYGHTKLTSWTVALPNLTKGALMFSNCTGLTSWTVALPNLTNGDRMFQSCTGLTSWTVALPNLTNGNGMFQSCTGLTSWTVALPNLTNGYDMFHNCTGLTSWTVALPNLTKGYGMFTGCKLDASSVLQILTTIPDRASAGLAVEILNIGSNTNFKDNADVAALLGTTAPIAAGTYSCKGWTITIMN